MKNTIRHNTLLKAASAITLACFVATSAPCLALQRQLVTDKGNSNGRNGAFAQALETARDILTTDVGKVPEKIQRLTRQAQIERQKRRLLEKYSAASLEEIEPALLASDLQEMNKRYRQAAMELIIGLGDNYINALLRYLTDKAFAAELLKNILSKDKNRLFNIIKDLELAESIYWLNQLEDLLDEEFASKIARYLDEDVLIDTMKGLSAVIFQKILYSLQLKPNSYKLRRILLGSANIRSPATYVYTRPTDTETRVILSRLPDDFVTRMVVWFAGIGLYERLAKIIMLVPVRRAAVCLAELDGPEKIFNALREVGRYSDKGPERAVLVMKQLRRVKPACVEAMFLDAARRYRNMLINLRNFLNDDELSVAEVAKAMSALDEPEACRQIIYILATNDERFTSKVVMQLMRTNSDLINRIVDRPRMTYFTDTVGIANIVALMSFSKAIETLNRLNPVALGAVVQTLVRTHPQFGRAILQSPALRLNADIKVLMQDVYEKKNALAAKIELVKGALDREEFDEDLDELWLGSTKLVLSEIGMAHYEDQMVYEKLEPRVIFSDKNIESRRTAMFLLTASEFNIYIDGRTKEIMLSAEALDLILEFLQISLITELRLPADEEVLLRDVLQQLGCQLVPELERQLRAFCRSRDEALRLEKFRDFDEFSINLYYLVYFSMAHLERISSEIPLVAPNLAIGDKFDNDRYLVKEVNNGGMSNIYVVQDLYENNKEKVIKMFKPPADPADWEYYEEMFYAEAEVLKALSQEPAVEDVIRFYDYQSKPNPQNPSERIVYMVIEYARGPTLEDVVSSAAGTVSQQDLIDYFIQAARIVQRIHGRGVIHRDIKPDNIIISKGSAKLCDFGLARSEQHAVYRSDRAPMGSPGFFAPEQLADFSNASREADIFSLGALLYYIFRRQPLEYTLNKDQDGRLIVESITRQPISPQIDAVIERATRMNPNERYHSVGQFLRDLQIALTQSPIMQQAAQASDRAQATSLLDALI